MYRAALRFSCAREGKLWYNFRERGDMAENKFREIFDVLKTDIIAGKYVGNASLPSAQSLRGECSAALQRRHVCRRREAWRQDLRPQGGARRGVRNKEVSRECAEAAFSALLERMRRPSVPPREILLPASLVVRESTRRL